MTLARKVVPFVASIGVAIAAVLAPVAPKALGNARSPLGAASTRGNGSLAFVSIAGGNRDVYRMSSDASLQVDLTNSPASDIDPAWSPDGAQLAFSSDRTGNYEIYIMSGDGTGVAQLTNDPAEDTQPAWSPDGQQIAFTSMRDGNAEVYVVSTDTTGLTNFTNNPASDRDPAWSPDGASIAFTSDRGGDDDVYLGTGTTITNLTNQTGDDGDAAWSPSGSKIAFTADRDGNREVYAMNPDGSGQTNLTSSPTADFGPVFSPDGGTRIAFTSDRTGIRNIFVLNYYPPTNFTYGLVSISGDQKEVVGSWQPLPGRQPASWPIDHVVVLYMENHSFNDVLGSLCVQDNRCLGQTTGTLHDGTTIQLAKAPDIVPQVAHFWGAQVQAMNGGQMNGFDLINGCAAKTGYACYMQYQPAQIPTIAGLARSFALSDHTFESYAVASFGSHISLVASVLDGFTRGGFIQGGPRGPGWGCNSGKAQLWFPTIFTTDGTYQPTCIPQPDGSGPYAATELPWVPTIMNRLDDAGLSWKLYAPQSNEGGYNWSVCPVFAGCLYTSQAQNFVKNKRFALDAAAGTLPDFSVVIPVTMESTHNKRSMLAGDNWIAEQVNAVMNGPDWGSTAIFLTWDDCGCFYDGVPPPDGLGIRTPMIIVSPFAKAGYTDTTVATYASMLAFVEHRWGLAPLGPDDQSAYDYVNSFNFSQRPIPPLRFATHPVPKWELDWIAKHPGPDNDVT